MSTIAAMQPYSPDFAQFEAAARSADLVPVYRQLLADRLTPVSAFSLLDDADHAFLLESVVGGERAARHSFIGAGPSLIYRAAGGKAEIEDRGGAGERGVRSFETRDPLGDLEKLLPRRRCHAPRGLPSFTGGLVGYAGYDTIRYYEGEKLPTPPPDDRRLPDVQFGLYGELVIFDHVDKTIKVIANADLKKQPNVKKAYGEACRRIDALVERLRRPPEVNVGEIAPEGSPAPNFQSNFTREAFEKAIEQGKEYIRAGDIFQFVPSQRLRVESKAEPFDVYRALRVVNPSPFMFYLRSPACTLIGSSPEILCRCVGGKVTSRPLAGTRRRGETEEEDQKLEAELLADPKERAEHIMLVDLHRNDVGRVATVGSVKIEDVMTVERYSHVMHITTNVTGELAEGRTAMDALRVSIPVGTVSGAPKIRAMQIIDELEPTRRGPYGGAVGYLDFRGDMDTCIALRTIVHHDGIFDVQAGAGVVADSDPAAEFEETMNKAKAMLKAVGIAERGFEPHVGNSTIFPSLGTPGRDREGANSERLPPPQPSPGVPREGETIRLGHHTLGFTMKRLLAWAALSLACVSTAKAADAQPPISLHPQNGHHLLFRGKPTILIGSTEHYGAVMNLDFDFEKYLRTLEAEGMNVTRTFSGAYVESPESFGIASNSMAPADGRFQPPWARSDQPGYAAGGNRFDLTRFNPAYFDRLKRFVAEAGRRGVVVEFVLFCPFYEEHQWERSPMNARNNVNGVGDVKRDKVYTGEEAKLWAVQEAMVRKVVSELKDFDNLYYEICNEPYFGGVTLEFQRKIADVIVDAEKDFPHKHLIAQNIANDKAKIENPNPAVSIFNFHYATPPATVGMNYGLNKVIADDETGFKGVEDVHYRTEAWDFIIAGGGIYDNLDYSFVAGHEDGTFKYPAKQPGGGSTELRKQLHILRKFMESFDFVAMKPMDDEIAHEGLKGATVRRLAKPGEAYAFYVRGDGVRTLRFKLPAGSYTAEWLDTKTGEFSPPQQVSGGEKRIELTPPAYREDIALKIVHK